MGIRCISGLHICMCTSYLCVYVIFVCVRHICVCTSYLCVCVRHICVISVCVCTSYLCVRERHIFVCVYVISVCAHVCHVCVCACMSCLCVRMYVMSVCVRHICVCVCTSSVTRSTVYLANPNRQRDGTLSDSFYKVAQRCLTRKLHMTSGKKRRSECHCAGDLHSSRWEDSSGRLVAP
ncbi:hypothetical protein XELAEV_18015787mg [Xenopus laevis]|uniref:Uncharacterized protein n=1 Tax=Xenopus laevis TaxID=8355 RepID=A0A974DJU1_XENLA|nr:hypothetical protein XELAEV_18015787mg [Xenopus laevis]